MKKPNIYGGGAQTNKNGLAFEQTTSLDSALEASGYSVMNNQVYREGQYIGISASKHAFTRSFYRQMALTIRRLIQKNGCLMKRLSMKRKKPYTLSKRNSKMYPVLLMKSFPTAILKGWNMKSCAILSAIRWNLSMYYRIGFVHRFTGIRWIILR